MTNGFSSIEFWQIFAACQLANFLLVSFLWGFHRLYRENVMTRGVGAAIFLPLASFALAAYAVL